MKTFDRNNSLSIGVDESGNTVYDSVFTVKNPYFLDKGLDLASESKKITVLIPSDELIKKALDEGKAKLKMENRTSGLNLGELVFSGNVFQRCGIRRRSFQ